MDFGTKNICVGKVGVSGQNCLRQLQLGAILAKTRFICPAEADMIYPEDYFEFVPPRDDRAYFAFPLWVLFALRGKAKHYGNKHRGSESAMIIGRECLIDGIERQMAPFGMWGPYHSNGESFQYLTKLIKQDRFDVKTPIITFKTDHNVHRKTPFKQESKTKELAPFGTAHEMIDRFSVNA